MVRIWLLSICVLVFLSCSRQEEVVKPPPVEFTQSDVCALCGMIILDYPGPKAQIHYRNGRIDRFCSVQEMMSFYLQPDRPRGITAMYVTDMSGRQWKSPGKWIDAAEAVYVYDAEVKGAMGNELVPFSSPDAAKAFIKTHGGRVVYFNDITLELLEPRL